MIPPKKALPTAKNHFNSFHSSHSSQFVGEYLHNPWCGAPSNPPNRLVTTARSDSFPVVFVQFIQLNRRDYPKYPNEQHDSYINPPHKKIDDLNQQ